MRLAIPPALLLTILRGTATANAFSLRQNSRSFVPPSLGTASLATSSSVASTALVGSSRRVQTGQTLTSTHLNVRGGAASFSALAMSKERPFATWTYDKHCDSMEWTSPPTANLTVSDASGDAAALQDADLVIVSVFAPAKDENEKEEEDEDKEKSQKEVEPIVFTGKARELDEALGGALTEMAAENGKAFQNGAEAGSMTPAMRVVGTKGEKVGVFVSFSFAIFHFIHSCLFS